MEINLLCREMSETVIELPVNGRANGGAQFLAYFP